MVERRMVIIALLKRHSLEPWMLSGLTRKSWPVEIWASSVELVSPAGMRSLMTQADKTHSRLSRTLCHRDVQQGYELVK
jgi:hypothetical protein